MTRKYRFEIFRDANKEWRFRFVAPNGRIIATGESYRTRFGCMKAIKSIKKHAADAEIVREER